MKNYVLKTDANLTANREGAIGCQDFDRTYQVVYPIGLNI